MPAGSWRQADRLDRERYLHLSASYVPTSEPATTSGGAPVVYSSQHQDTLYALLGVECTASAAEVRRAYRRLLVTAHPDKGGPRERFEQLQAAYAVLSDPEERLIYDEKLERSLGVGRSNSKVGPGCTTTDLAAAEAARSCGRLQRSTAGVTAVVHGQTQGTPQQQQQQPPRHNRQPPEWACQLSAAATAIESASAARGPGAAAALGQAHLARAALYRAAGQLHHALFDAEEALRVQPELEGAAALAEQLRAAIAAAEQVGPAGKPQQTDCSSSSSSEDDESVGLECNPTCFS